jgi:putative transcriptional regulator
VTSTAGRLLVAEPMLDDPNFDRTVILMVEHSDEGALGLVLNRPTDVDVVEALPAWRSLVADPPVLFVGGPVEGQSGWCLARLRPGVHQSGFVSILGHLGLLELDLDPAELAGPVLAARIYAGYSGWGPGQLEQELAEGTWFVLDADPADPFLPDGEQLWQRILARQTGSLARLSLFPPDPSLN